MEQVLWLYALPCDPAYPVVCFDERPCFLIGQEVAPLNAKPGQVAKEHYAYRKNGSCARCSPPSNQKPARDWRGFTPNAPSANMPSSCRAWPSATLPPRKSAWSRTTSTPTASVRSTRAFPPRKLLRWPSAPEFFFTPKSASWLKPDRDRVLGLLARECLHRRMPTFEAMECEILALVEERAAKAIKIDWQFSLGQARDKFARHYQALRQETPACYDI
jgi:hypothetical protein